MSAPDLEEQRRLIEFAAKAAETFVSAYYSASDSPHRVQVSAAECEE
jgi:NTF2-related export protein 1/2